MKYLSIILISISLFSCAPQQRLNRLLNKHPYLASKDTLHVVDTVRHITNKVEVDTITNLNSIRQDTFIINKENLTIKTIVHKDSVFIWGQCDADTVYTILERSIPYDKFEYQEIKKWKKWIGWLVVLLLSIIGIGLLLKILPLIRKILGF